MFRAISCSSSGGQIVLIQHLVSSLSVSDSPVHKLSKKSSFSTCAPDVHLRAEIDDTRYSINLFKAQRFLYVPPGLTLKKFYMVLNLCSLFGRDLRIENEVCFIRYKLIRFYNRGGKCLLRGTDWVFK